MWKRGSTTPVTERTLRTFCHVYSTRVCVEVSAPQRPWPSLRASQRPSHLSGEMGFSQVQGSLGPLHCGVGGLPSAPPGTIDAGDYRHGTDSRLLAVCRRLLSEARAADPSPGRYPGCASPDERFVWRHPGGRILAQGHEDDSEDDHRGRMLSRLRQSTSESDPAGVQVGRFGGTGPRDHLSGVDHRDRPTERSIVRAGNRPDRPGR